MIPNHHQNSLYRHAALLFAPYNATARITLPAQQKINIHFHAPNPCYTQQTLHIAIHPVRIIYPRR
jgi:hypothetical protein